MVLTDEVVSTWADVSSPAFWQPTFAKHPGVFAPGHPWPGYIGSRYDGIVVIAQNPRASAAADRATSDAEVETDRRLDLFAARPTREMLLDVFAYARRFLLGEVGRAWRPVSFARAHLGVEVDDAVFLNVIPLATIGERVHVDGFRAAYQLSTAKQLAVLDPAPRKIVVYGEAAANQFKELSRSRYPTRHVQQRNYERAADIRAWLQQDDGT